MTKTESVLIASELRKIQMNIEQLNHRLVTLTQDIQGSATLYGRKSKIKGPAKDASQIHSTRSTTGEKAASVSTNQ